MGQRTTPEVIVIGPLAWLANPLAGSRIRSSLEMESTGLKRATERADRALVPHPQAIACPVGGRPLGMRCDCCRYLGEICGALPTPFDGSHR